MPFNFRKAAGWTLLSLPFMAAIGAAVWCVGFWPIMGPLLAAVGTIACFLGGIALIYSKR